MDFLSRISHDPIDEDARRYGYDKAAAGEAFVGSAGKIVIADSYNRVASPDEASGVRAYWRDNGYYCGA
jgi:hypothetical protein